MHVGGLILAGGQSRRMGGVEKCFLPVGGAAMLQRVLRILKPQCAMVAISANGDASRFDAFDCPVIADESPGSGPLAGLVAALDWFALRRPGISHILSAPADTPFLPADLRPRLEAALTARNAFCACAVSGGRIHFVAGLWPVTARHALREAMAQHSFHAALEGRDVALAEWPVEPIDPFLNVNTPADLEHAQRRAPRHNIPNM